MADYIQSAAGESSEVTITLAVTGTAGDLVIPALTSVQVSNANDTFVWEQLDVASKKQIATTSTNNITCDIVVDELTFFGNSSATSGSAEFKGLIGLSDSKTRTAFEVNIGANKTLTGNCYVTGLAPSITAASPVWTSSVTLAVDGEYTVS